MSDGAPATATASERRNSVESAQSAGTSEPPRRFFPSAWAAFITGCLLPLLGENFNYLQGQGVSDLVLIPLVIFGIQLPMLVATVDFTYYRRQGKRIPWFRPSIPTSKDFDELYFPAWGRMAVLFLGAVISVLVRSGHVYLRP